MSYEQYAKIVSTQSDDALDKLIVKHRHDRDNAISDRAWEAWNRMLQIELTESVKRLAAANNKR